MTDGNNLQGYEYFWESGDFVLHRKSASEHFPCSFEIFDKAIGCYVNWDSIAIEKGGQYVYLQDELIRAMRENGVPIVDDISLFNSKSMELVRRKLQGSISKEQFETEKKLLQVEEKMIRESRWRHHIDRHPEQL